MQPPLPRTAEPLSAASGADTAWQRAVEFPSEGDESFMCHTLVARFTSEGALDTTSARATSS